MIQTYLKRIYLFSSKLCFRNFYYTSSPSEMKCLYMSLVQNINHKYFNKCVVEIFKIMDFFFSTCDFIKDTDIPLNF